MKQFNFKKAWYTLALPAYLELPKQAMEFVKYVAETYESVNQDRDLGMPEFDDVLIYLREISDADLSSWAQTIYSAGYWLPSGIQLTGIGNHWKVSKLLDQELARRVLKTESRPLIDSRNRVEVRDGLALWIDNGQLNMAYSHTWGFGNVFGIGTPTKALVEELFIVLADRPVRGRARVEDWEDEMRARANAVKARHVGEVWDIEPFMEEGGW